SQREGPGVALVGNVGLEDAERSRAPTGEAVLEAARHLGDVGEVALGQEASDLEVRVHALLEAPAELHDQPLAEADRVVALLDAPDRDVEPGSLRPAQAG